MKWKFLQIITSLSIGVLSKFCELPRYPVNRTLLLLTIIFAILLTSTVVVKVVLAVPKKLKINRNFERKIGIKSSFFNLICPN